MEENTSQEISESILFQSKAVNRLMDNLENSTKVKSVMTEDRFKSLELKLANANAELDFLKVRLKEAEDDNKQKAKTIEETNEEFEKLSRRLDSCPWTPYALIQKHQFNEVIGTHTCQCIICGEEIKNHTVLFFISIAVS